MQNSTSSSNTFLGNQVPSYCSPALLKNSFSAVEMPYLSSFGDKHHVSTTENGLP